MYIRQLTLTSHPLRDYGKEVSTELEQTAEHILAMAEEVNKIDHTIRTVDRITTTDGSKLWVTITKMDSLGNRVITHESSSHVTVQQINTIVSRTDKMGDDLGITDHTIKTISWITTAGGNKLWAIIDRVGVLGSCVATHESNFHVTAQRINTIVSRMGTIDGTVSNTGWTTTTNDNKL